MPSSPKPRESNFTAKALTYLRQCGAFAEKIGSGQRKGMPDVVACYRGRFIGVETKRLPGQEASPAQAQVLSEIEEAEGKTVVACTMEQLRAILYEIDAELLRDGWD